MHQEESGQGAEYARTSLGHSLRQIAQIFKADMGLVPKRAGGKYMCSSSFAGRAQDSRGVAALIG